MQNTNNDINSDSSGYFHPGDRGHFLVTGASGSLGAEVVKSLLRKNFSVIMACRNLQKGKNVRDEILKEIEGKEEYVSLAELDMGSLASIRQFVEILSGKNIRLSGLMNNAGTMNRLFSLTPDGFENTLAVNYLGIFRLTKLLLPMLEQGSGIVNVVSMTMNPVRVDPHLFNFSSGKFTQLGSYSQSKTALIVYTASLAENMQGKFYVNAVDPGIVDTNILTLHRWFDPLADLLFRPFIKSPAKGAIPLVNALLSNQTGKLFSGNTSIPIPEKYSHHHLQEWLWNETEQISSEKAQL